jgi:hypothetical protein
MNYRAYVYTFKEKEYWFGAPRGPSWVLKRLISPKICLKMGNGRVYLVITTKISMVYALDGLKSVHNN